MNPEHGFGGDHERAVEAGKKGGQTSGSGESDSSSSNDGGSATGGTYKPSEHDGLKVSFFRIPPVHFPSSLDGATRFFDARADLSLSALLPLSSPLFSFVNIGRLTEPPTEE